MPKFFAVRFDVPVLLVFVCARLWGQELQEVKSGSSLPSVPAEFNLNNQTDQFLWNAFGPEAFATAGTFGAMRYEMRHFMDTNGKRVQLAERVETNLLRHGTREAIEFGTAAILRQPQGFTVSDERQFARRWKAALYHSMFITTAQGDEFAFPRAAAILGTPWVMRDWHPGKLQAPNPWIQSGIMLGRYVARSYWAEFKPDIKNAWHKALRHP